MKNLPPDIKRLMATVRASRIKAVCEMVMGITLAPMAAYMATTRQLPQALLLGVCLCLFLNKTITSIKQIQNARRELNRHQK